MSEIRWKELDGELFSAELHSTAGDPTRKEEEEEGSPDLISFVEIRGLEGRAVEDAGEEVVLADEEDIGEGEEEER